MSITDSSGKSTKINTGNVLLDILLVNYGPQAFGFLMLMVLWMAMVKPQLDSHRLDFESQQEVVATMKETSATIEQTARTMKATAETLDRVCVKLGEK